MIKNLRDSPVVQKWISKVDEMYHLSDDEWLAVNTILDESTVRHIIPRLKEAGGEGIVEYPLNKVIH